MEKIKAAIRNAQASLDEIRANDPSFLGGPEPPGGAHFVGDVSVYQANFEFTNLLGWVRALEERKVVMSPTRSRKFGLAFSLHWSQVGP